MDGFLKNKWFNGNVFCVILKDSEFSYHKFTVNFFKVSTISYQNIDTTSSRDPGENLKYAKVIWIQISTDQKWKIK